MAKVWKATWTEANAAGAEAALRADGGAFLITVPEGWCYRILREAPPGGWSKALRDELRPGLFPEPLEDLWWDEAIHPDGAWEVWALPARRKLSWLMAQEHPRGRRGRLCTEAHWEASPHLAAFPNLAPPAARPFRWPWPQIRRAAAWGGGPLAAAVLVAAAWTYQSRSLARIQARARLLEVELQSQQRTLDQEMALMRVLSPGSRKGAAPFIQDLDALTRLTPEDSHAAGLRWTPERVELDLITPRAEAIREALEAAPEFQGVRMEGLLERRQELSRLTLSMRPEGSR